MLKLDRAEVTAYRAAYIATSKDGTTRVARIKDGAVMYHGPLALAYYCDVGSREWEREAPECHGDWQALGDRERGRILRACSADPSQRPLPGLTPLPAGHERVAEFVGHRLVVTTRKRSE